MAMVNRRTSIPTLIYRIEENVKDMKIQAEINKRHENKAALVIQRWIRGYLTRNHLKFINACATLIQKYIRGYLARRYVGALAQIRYRDMTRNYYHQKATTIQAAWRGYCIRKEFNYHCFKKWLNSVKEQNEKTLEKMKLFNEQEQKRREAEMVNEYETWIEYMASKLHHLIRTKQRPGIYSKRGTTELSDIETLLAKNDFRVFIRKLKEERIKGGLTAIFSVNENELCAHRTATKRCPDTLQNRHNISKPLL